MLVRIALHAPSQPATNRAVNRVPSAVGTETDSPWSVTSTTLPPVLLAPPFHTAVPTRPSAGVWGLS